MTMTKKSLQDELIELDKKHFIHPTSNMKQLQEEGPSFIFTDGDGIYLKDVEGRKLMDSLSSLWNVNIGHGRKELDRKSTRLNSSHVAISYAVFCLKQEIPY